MTRNKLAFQVRRAAGAAAGQPAQRRDAGGRAGRRQRHAGAQRARGRPRPDRRVRLRLGSEERQIADLRAEGWEWSEIAGRLGGSAQARRMQLARAVHRVAKSLKLDADADA